MRRSSSFALLAALLLPAGQAAAQSTPSPATDATLLPPPNEATPAPSTPPTSTTGTDIATSAPSAAPVVTSPSSANTEARLQELEHRVAHDEAQLNELEKRAGIFKHLRLESFIQPQLSVQTYNTAASPNLQANGHLPPGIGANDTIAKSDGTTTNGTFFRVRRARMRMFYETDVMRMFIQIDGMPAGGVGPGIGTILRNAEATGIARWTRDIRTEFTAGLFFTPFRAELLEPSFIRPFIERTWFVQNVFPKERDYGAHVKTIAFKDRLAVDLSVVNGQRLGEKEFVALPDLNRSKDFIAYVTYRLPIVTLGASGYIGRGQIVDAQQLRFKQFDRWAVNGQAKIAHRFLENVGDTRLSSELTFAENMDSGVNYAFAVPKIGANIADEVQSLDERGLYVRFEQDIKRYFTVGYRYDMYTPNSALKNNARDTHAWLAVWHISPNLQLMEELGWVIDNVHPVGAPAPSRQSVYSSTVLQAMF
jgi:hypothetical protein